MEQTYEFKMKDGKRYEVTVEIDRAAIARRLGLNAIGSKSKRATGLHGAVVVKAKEIPA